MIAVGQHVRLLRQERGWTLANLAERCELSTSFISQLERGLCSISIASLETICGALGVTLGDFFTHVDGEERDASDMEVMMAHDKPAVSLSEGLIAYRFLSRCFVGRKLDAVVGHISAGYDYPPTSHEGEEFGYVLEGRLRLTIGDRVYRLKPGDSYHFGPLVPHGYAADEVPLVKVLWVGTLLGFRRRDGRPTDATRAEENAHCPSREKRVPIGQGG
jgi:transcriptional regulator with XRE-family HTH domain